MSSHSFSTHPEKSTCKDLSLKGDSSCREELNFYPLQCLGITHSTKGITVPPNTVYMKVLLVGGGGAGGKFQDSEEGHPVGGGGGGGGGTYFNDSFSVTPGEKFDVLIGAGGIDEGNDGNDGENTVLTYCKTILLAHGGRGGHSGVSGGKGGRGGAAPLTQTERKEHSKERKHSKGRKHISSVQCKEKQSPKSKENRGKAGMNGKNGVPYTGGCGGKANLECKRMLYGKGGNGGSREGTPGSIVCPPETCPCEPCDCGCCPPDFQNPVPNPIGDSGISGYAEITFYAQRCDLFKEEKCPCKGTLQTIVVNKECFWYAINPNVDVVTVDTSNYPADLLLPVPQGNYAKIEIKLLHGNGLSANIHTTTGGTFTLSPLNPVTTLVYGNCFWSVDMNISTYRSFYPTTQQGPSLLLNGYSAINADILSTAISANGRTLAVGARNADNGLGAVYIFERKCQCWEVVARLQGFGVAISNPPTASPVQQGASVSLSADGKTLAVGAPGDNNGVGAVFIFIRKKGHWVQQGTKLITGDNVGYDNLGMSVSLSADGNILAIGAPNYLTSITNSGSVVIFTRKNCIWSQQSRVPGLNNQVLGYSLGLSANGNTLAVRGTSSTNIYLRVAGVYTLQQVLTYSGNTDLESPNSIALSSDSNTLAIGFSDSVGYVEVYNKWGGIFSLNNTLIPSDAVDNAGFGFSVSLSADGSTLAVGGPFDDNNRGATWIYTFAGGFWQEKQKLIGVENSGQLEQGAGVALSSNGGILGMVGLAGISPAEVAGVWVFA